jgi:hypothetical protein
MELLSAVILLIGSFAIGIAGNLVASDLYDRAPSMAQRLIDMAVTRLPDNTRERYREEWHAHLHEVSGNVSKLCHALGCFMFAASGVTKAYAASAKISSRSRVTQALKQVKTLLGTTSPLQATLSALAFGGFVYVFSSKVESALRPEALYSKSWAAIAETTALPCVLIVLFGWAFAVNQHHIKQEMLVASKLFASERDPKQSGWITIYSMIAFVALYQALAWFAGSIVVVSGMYFIIACNDFSSRIFINNSVRDYLARHSYQPLLNDEDNEALGKRRSVALKFFFRRRHRVKDIIRAACSGLAFLFAIIGYFSSMHWPNFAAYSVIIGTIMANEAITFLWRLEMKRDMKEMFLG